MTTFKNVLVLLIILCTSLNFIYAQCSATLNTQAAVDNFSTNFPCTSFNVLAIVDNQTDPITNLDGLSGVVEVANTLVINNTSLTNIDGLSGITSLEGQIIVNNNALLTNLDGLSNMSSSGLNFQFLANPQLVNIDGLANVTSSETILMVNNSQLQSIDGLSGITGSVRSITINQSPLLENIDALSGITSITGPNPQGSVLFDLGVTNIDGLSNLTEINSGFTISNLDQITNLDPLANLTSIGGKLFVLANDNLTDITGLENIVSVAGDLEVRNNTSLTQCCPIYDLINISGAVNGDIVVINGTPTNFGCGSAAQVTPCGPVVIDNDEDGFDSEEDCDDDNANVNPGKEEIIYDGLDNDCDPSTLDDDLDGDGLVFADDCDDSDPAIGALSEIFVPFTYDGTGVFCWATTDNLEAVNSWSLDYLIINGVDLTNTYSNNLPPKIDGEYLIEFSSSVSWGHFEASGSSGANNNSCDEPVSIEVPFSQDGSGEYCWVTTSDIGNINSWALNSLIINGEDYTNFWSSSLPPKIDGEYIIEYSGNFTWSHFEANPLNGNMVEQDSDGQESAFATNSMNESENTDVLFGTKGLNKLKEASFKVYPNPAEEELFLQLKDFIGKDISISMVNHLGQKLYSVNKTNLEDATLKISLENYESGLYFIRLIIDQNESINKSFIVQK